MCDHSRLLTRLLTLVSLHSRSIGFGQPHNKHRVCSGLLKYVSRNFDRKYRKNTRQQEIFLVVSEGNGINPEMGQCNAISSLWTSSYVYICRAYARNAKGKAESNASLFVCGFPRTHSTEASRAHRLQGLNVWGRVLGSTHWTHWAGQGLNKLKSPTDIISKLYFFHLCDSLFQAYGSCEERVLVSL